VGKFHIHPNDLRVVTFAAIQLLRDVHAKMLRNLHISALDDDVHKSSCLAGNSRIPTGARGKTMSRTAGNVVRAHPG
jgi:hypothetical protein